jgi:hypothetical protein
MKKNAEKLCAAAPLPCRGGVRGGVSIFLPLNKLVTPPLPWLRPTVASLPNCSLLVIAYKGGEYHTACSSTVADFLKWTHFSTFASSFLNAEPQSFRELHDNSWSAQRVAEATCKARKGRRNHSANSANALAFLSKLPNTLMLCVFAFIFLFAKVELNF